VQRGYASSLIGKEVCFDAKAADGATGSRTGVVEEVTMGDHGDIALIVDGQNVPLVDVKGIRE
jgi:hypothetical protein